MQNVAFVIVLPFCIQCYSYNINTMLSVSKGKDKTEMKYNCNSMTFQSESKETWGFPRLVLSNTRICESMLLLLDFVSHFLILNYDFW